MSTLKKGKQDLKKVIDPTEEIPVVRKPLFRRRRFLFICALSILTTVLAILTYFAKRYTYFPIDLTVTINIQKIHFLPFDTLMKVITLMGNNIEGVVLVIVISLFFFIKGRQKEALMIIGSTGGIEIVAYFLKIFVSRHRPHSPLIIYVFNSNLDTYSFPSGHVCFYMGLFGFLLYLVYTLLPKNIYRTILIIFISCLLSLVGVSRIYLGAHWFSDVIGAYVLGSIWLLLMIYIHDNTSDIHWDMQKIKLNNTYLRIFISLLFIVLLIIFISKSLDLEHVFSLISNFPREDLIILGLLLCVISIIKAYRFFLILKRNNIKTSFWVVCKIYLTGQMTSPLPGGEAFRGVLLNKEVNADLVTIGSTVIVQSFLEFLSAAIIAILGSFFYRLLREQAILALTLLIIIIILLTNKKVLKWILDLCPSFPILDRITKKILEAHKNIKSSILRKDRNLPNTFFLIALGISFLTIAIGGVMIHIITHDFNQNLSFVKSTFIYASSIVLTAVGAFIPGSLGVTESGITGLLVLSKINVYTALAIVLIFRAITLVLYMLIGMIFWIVFYARSFILRDKTNHGKDK